MAPRITPPIDRFWTHVDFSNPRGCWLWTAGRSKEGYGKFWVDGRTVPAHRWLLEYVHGPLPNGLFACHHCDNEPCVRLDHLFSGTNTDNQQDAIRKGIVDPYHIVRAHQQFDWRGENGAGHRLTPLQVQAIRMIDYSRHGTQAQVAREYGVSSSCISAIRRRNSWENIP
jgi:HNH endonuclease